MIGPTARALGVRPDDDIPVIDGMVDPATGGMPVAPETPFNLPIHRRPAALGGTGKDPVWRIDLATLGPDLSYRQDHSDHGLIEPIRLMSLEALQQALANLSSTWKR